MTKKEKVYYIKTHETTDIDDNGCFGGKTYYIKGEISDDGKHWEECEFVWDGKNEPGKEDK